MVIITPLHLALCQNTEEEVTSMKKCVLVDPGSLHRPMHSLQYSNVTPIISALRMGHEKCTAFFVKEGADVANAKNEVGDDAFLCAIRGNNLDCVKLVAPFFDVVYHGDDQGSTYYLEEACKTKNHEIVEYLLDLGAPVVDVHLNANLRNTYKPPVFAAAVHGNRACLAAIFQKGRTGIDMNNPIHRMAVDRVTDLRNRDLSMEERKDTISLLSQYGVKAHPTSSEDQDPNLMNYVKTNNGPFTQRQELLDFIAGLEMRISLPALCRRSVFRDRGPNRYFIDLPTFQLPPGRVVDSTLSNFMSFKEL